MSALRRLSWLSCLLAFATVLPLFGQKKSNNVTVNVYAYPTPTPTPTPKATPKPEPPDTTMAAQRIKLFYLRDAGKVATVLNEIAAKDDSKLKGLVAKSAADDELILYGPSEQRKHAWQIIAALDLPRAGVDMEMWGIQIASNKPGQMEKVMPAVRQQIDSTQQAVHRAYAKLQEVTLEEIPESDLNKDFRTVLVNELGYRSALDSDRPLSLTDILLRTVAADNSGYHTERIANRLTSWFRQDFLVDPCPTHKKKVRLAESRVDDRPVPFRRFFTLRGLEFSGGQWHNINADRRSLLSRNLIVDFGLYYGWLVHQPQTFDPYYLQQSAEALNSRLQEASNAVNADVEEMFVRPTLERIGEIVHCYDDVDYAQVGKVSVASLSGIETAVTSTSVNTFDVTPPLTLSDLLSKASDINKNVTPFDPAANTIGALSLSQVIGLVAAFGEQEAVSKQLQSGVSVTVTPNVLRNMTSAELKIDLKTGDPQMSGTQEKDVRPISRVSQHNVKTSVYVNALDFFDLSAFVSQATLGGGRGYVPVIGPIWRGLFGEVPVAGKLFSWQRSPKTVYSDSLILTNSFITPTAMGIALLYPTARPRRCLAIISSPENTKIAEDKLLDVCFKEQSGIVDDYKRRNQHSENRRY
jgi:hypothetical protein